MKFLTFLLTLLIYFSQSYNLSALELPALISDNMVIKRNTKATLWGWSKPGETVKVSSSWGQNVETLVDKNGRWKTKIKTPAADGQALTMTFRDSAHEITINNILAGDVWLASGQSNMQFTLEKCREIEKENLNFPAVRRMRIPHNAALEPLERFAAPLPWTPVNKEILKSTSATSYFFARHLYQKTGIPQGIIDSAWNGMNLEPFYAAKELKELYPEEYKAMLAHPSSSACPSKNHTVCFPE